MSNTNNNDYKIKPHDISQAFNAAAKGYDAAALLQHTVADRLMESFDQIKIEPKKVLDLGSGTGYVSKKLKQRFKKAQFFQCDISEAMLSVARHNSPSFFSRNHFLCANAEQMPIATDQFDLVISSLMLQWCNDLDAVFKEIKRILKPGGFFIFASFGPDTLKELRESWQQVDEHVHVNAFVDMHDAGDALMRNGLEGPVLSVEHIVLTYSECKVLMQELKSIGAHNINTGRRKTLTGKQRLRRVMEHYETFRVDNKLPATYEIVYGHAWSPEQEKAGGEKGGQSQTISLEKLRQNLKTRKTGS